MDILTKDSVVELLQKRLDVETDKGSKIEIKKLMKLDFHSKLLHSLSLALGGEKSFFLTGKPGTGKSVFVNLYKYLSKGKSYALVAPTGTAALNIGGSTIHSMFNFDFGLQGRESPYDLKDEKLGVLRALETLIIDEISMCRSDILEGISYCLRYAKNSTKPFGGVQMIFTGDLFQIPPIIQPEFLEVLEMQGLLGAKPFHSKEYVKLSPERIIFDKVYRQDNREFLDILDRMRTSDNTDEDFSILNKKDLPEDTQDFTFLCTTRKAVEKINRESLKQLEKEELTVYSEIQGKFPKGSYPTSEELILKIGARVVLLSNNYEENAYFVNGDMGVVKDVLRDSHGAIDSFEVSLDRTQGVVEVKPKTWENIEFVVVDIKDEGGNLITKRLEKTIVGTFKQFPIMLGYAQTIHKSQGKTLDKVVIDLGRGAFATGMSYVAVSRCTSLENLYFKTPIYPKDIFCDKEVVDYLSEKVEVDFEKDEKELRVLFDIVYDTIKPHIGETNSEDVAFEISEKILERLKFKTALTVN